MPKQNGFTLIEVMVVIFFLTLGTALMGATFSKHAKRKADIVAIKDMLTLASRESLNDASHYGMHYDSLMNTIGWFEDENNDDLFSSTDTLKGIISLTPGSKLFVIDSDSLMAFDICFKKNGATASELSYDLTYVGPLKDTINFQVIAASGILENGI